MSTRARQSGRSSSVSSRRAFSSGCARSSETRRRRRSGSQKATSPSLPPPHPSRHPRALRRRPPKPSPRRRSWRPGSTTKSSAKRSKKQFRWASLPAPTAARSDTLQSARNPANCRAFFMTEAAYTAKDITVLEGLEPVRLRPGMYIGSTGSRGLHHLVYEVVDNSVDEALAGRNDRLEVILHPDNSVTVRDQGSGIPVD